MRNREHDMAVPDRQQIFCSVCQPVISCPTVALWAMAISARVVHDLLVRAAVTLLDVMHAEFGGAACDDIPERPVLLARKRMPPAIQELLSVLSEDIGDFESPRCHRRRPSPSESVIAMTSRLSKGLAVEASVRFETCKYRAVVSRSA